MSGSHLVGGLEHGWIVTFHILEMSSSQLTFIFFRGVETTNHYILPETQASNDDGSLN